MAVRDEAGTAPAGTVVIGLFPDQETAGQAIRQLQEAGFTNEELSTIMRSRGPTGEPLMALVEGEDLDLEAQSVKAGAATGGIIGGVLGLLGSLLIPGLGPVTVGGVLVSTLVGAGVGTVAGGLVGMLVGMGLSKAEAAYFDRGVRAGGVLVLVQPASGRVVDARAILQDVGADLGPDGAAASAAPATATVEGSEDEEPWRGNERRYSRMRASPAPSAGKCTADGVHVASQEVIMEIRLHPPGFAHAQAFIEAGSVFLDRMGAWSEHRPTEVERNRYFGQHGLAAYGKWHLGIDEEEDEHSRRRYVLPYGDFLTVHRCGVLAVESEAARAKYYDTQEAAGELRGMLDLLKRELELEAGASLSDDRR